MSGSEDGFETLHKLPFQAKVSSPQVCILSLLTLPIAFSDTQRRENLSPAIFRFWPYKPEFWGAPLLFLTHDPVLRKWPACGLRQQQSLVRGRQLASSYPSERQEIPLPGLLPIQFLLTYPPLLKLAFQRRSMFSFIEKQTPFFVKPKWTPHCCLRWCQSGVHGIPPHDSLQCFLTQGFLRGNMDV